MKTNIFTFFFVFFFAFIVSPKLFALQRVITVSPNGTNDIAAIKTAIATAKTYVGDTVIIKLGGGTYQLNRNQTTNVKYYISNTLGWGGPPDNIKNIGVYFKKMKNIVLDGEGARLITHGEITSVVVDSCENITLKNFSVDAADPSVTEMTVSSINGNDITYKVHPTSNYSLSGTSITWKGEFGWSFTGGYAQLYDPQQNITWRCDSPTNNVTAIADLGNKQLKITYSTLPAVKVGWTYQMRDGVRDQVAGFIHRSKNVVYDHVNMYFMGNFSIISQYTDSITYANCWFAPEQGSGRTCCGYADFLHFSGCKGLIKVQDSYFNGAQDDPINVHGTYLKVQNYNSSTQVKVKFMQHESWGFEAFSVGDSIEFVDVASMITLQSAKVTAVQRNDDQNITLTFDNPVDVTAFQAKSSGVVVENITWTPEVLISRNYFTCVPTRGILLTTRRHSVIEDNTFYKMQMQGVYISGDAASWYESGKVCDLTIRNNKFIKCGSPVIYFDPTNTVNNGFVHNNILIEGNTFDIASGEAVAGRNVDDITIINDTVIASGASSVDSYFNLSNSSNIVKSGNVKLQPQYLSLKGKTVEASSSLSTNDKTFAADGDKTTSWKPQSTDAEKWWKVDMGKLLCLNRIQLVFSSSSVYKYTIEVSKDNIIWEKVIDQSDNNSFVSTHMNYGNLGRNVQFVKVKFSSASAGLSEVNVFGEENLPLKPNLLTGTVIGTAGSWSNDPSTTRDAVFDFDTNSYFDSPTATGWIGLDLGVNSSFRIDSILYAPRQGSSGRMLNGTFEISKSSSFSSKTILYTIATPPPTGYSFVSVNNSETGRYVRYNGPSDGYGNIAEVEFYGTTPTTSVSQPSNNKYLSNIMIDKANKRIKIELSECQNVVSVVTLMGMDGKVIRSNTFKGNSCVLAYNNSLQRAFIVRISNSIFNKNTKVIL